MDLSLHTLGAAGMALSVAGGMCWLYAAGALFPRMTESDGARMRFLRMGVIALDLSITGFICLGGWGLIYAQASFWKIVLAALVGAGLMMFAYLLHHKLRAVDADRGTGLFTRNSFDGTMLDLVSNAPAAALLWITIAA